MCYRIVMVVRGCMLPFGMKDIISFNAKAHLPHVGIILQGTAQIWYAHHPIFSGQEQVQMFASLHGHHTSHHSYVQPTTTMQLRLMHSMCYLLTGKL